MDDHTGAPPSATGDSSPEDRLDSWKEIAAYLRHDVRTVQRWEKITGLPVHRLSVGKHGSVHAYKSELNAWYAERRYLDSEPEGAEIKDTEETPKRRRVRRFLGISAAVLAVLSSVSYVVSRGGWLGAHSAHKKIKLAVLPFKNLSADPEKEYFSDGMTEEMITELSRMQPERLGVIARTSVMSYKNLQKNLGQICHELGVQYVLEGSVFPAGDRARITAQLIQCSDQTHIWAESSEQNLENVLALQRMVAQDIVRNIKPSLEPGKQAQFDAARRVNPQAYQDYLKGLYFWEKFTPEATQRAIEYLQTAIDEDPSYAPAHARLADCYFEAHIIRNLPYAKALSHIKATATKALVLDPNLGEAHVELAHVGEMEWDWSFAEREFHRAIEVEPNLVLAHISYGNFLMLLRRSEESWNEMRTGQALDPISQVTALTWLLNLYYSRRYDEAIAFAKQWLELYPDSPGLHYYLAESYLRKGIEALALDEYLKAEALGGSTLSRVAALQKASRNSGLRGFWQTKLAFDKNQANPAFNAYEAAMDYAALGDRENLLVWLERAYTDREWLLSTLSVDPRLDAFRSDTRFQDLLRRLRLPQ